MHIVCPHCNFSKDIPESAIPAGHDQVVCPKCKDVFALTTVPLKVSTVAELSESSESSQIVEIPDNYAGFWVRGAALFIDSMAVGIIQLTAVVLFGMLLLSDGMTEDRIQMMQILIQLFSFCLSLVYYVFFTGYFNQTTFN